MSICSISESVVRESATWASHRSSERQDLRSVSDPISSRDFPRSLRVPSSSNRDRHQLLEIGSEKCSAPGSEVEIFLSQRGFERMTEWALGFFCRDLLRKVRKPFLLSFRATFIYLMAWRVLCAFTTIFSCCDLNFPGEMISHHDVYEGVYQSNAEVIAFYNLPCQVIVSYVLVITFIFWQHMGWVKHTQSLYEKKRFMLLGGRWLQSRNTSSIIWMHWRRSGLKTRSCLPTMLLWRVSSSN